MIAVTTEGWVVIGFGGLIILVGLIVFWFRGDKEAHGGFDARWVKFSAPASLVGVGLGALLILVGTGFLSLGGAQGGGDARVGETPTSAPLVPTTSTTPTSTVITFPVEDASAPPPPPELAFTGPSSSTVLAGVGILLLSSGVYLRRFT